MNAIELLKADHRNVEALFQQVKETEGEDHTDVFAKIKDELDAHTHIEETIFYPKCIADGNDDLKKIVLEGIEEHHQVKMFIKELAALKGSNEKFDPKLKVLMEDVAHHVTEEETGMFPLAEALFGEKALDEIGTEMEAAKELFKKEEKAKAASQTS